MNAVTGSKPVPHHPLDLKALADARLELTGFVSCSLNAVTIGTPHASLNEVEALLNALNGRRINPDTPLFIQMNAFTKEDADSLGRVDHLLRSGVTIMPDTCLHWRPNMAGLHGRVMTNSAKFACYAPGELGLCCRIGSLKECVESAVRGTVWSDQELGIP